MYCIQSLLSPSWPTQICPTVGFNIKTLDYKGYVLNMWDVGGQKSIRTYWRNYFEQTDGIIWVVDSVDQWRLEECKRQLRDLLSQEVRCRFHLLFLAFGGTIDFLCRRSSLGPAFLSLLISRILLGPSPWSVSQKFWT